MLEVLAGAGLGLAAGSFGAFVLYQTMKILKDLSHVKTGAILFLLLGFLLKFPALIGAGYLSFQLSYAALYAFTAAVAMVYFWLVWRAARKDLF